MSLNNDNNKDHWSDDWPVQRDDPLAQGLHLEQPFLATGPSLAACSGSDIHLAKSATASNKQRCLALLPGVLSLKPPAVNKEDTAAATTATVTTATTTTKAPAKPDEDNNDDNNDDNNNNNNNKPRASERIILGSLTGLGTSTTPTLTLGGGGDEHGDSSLSSPKLQLQGKLLPSTSKFVVLTLQPKKKRVICKHIFDSVMVFGEPQAVVSKQETDDDDDDDQDVKMPAAAAAAAQDASFFHYGCSVRTIDGGSAIGKNGEINSVVEDPYLNPSCVFKRTSENASAAQTPAKPLWQETKRRQQHGGGGGNMNKDDDDDDDDTSSAASVFEGKTGNDDDDDDEYKISFSQETLGRRTSSQRKSRKTVRYSEVASSEDGDSDDEPVATKKTSLSSSSRRAVSRKSASSKVMSDESEGEQSAAENTSEDDDNDDDDEEYTYVDPNVGASRSRSANGRRNSTRKRKTPPLNKDSSSKTTTKSRKKAMRNDEIFDDSSIEIVEVDGDDDDDSDVAYVDPNVGASRSSSSIRQASSRKRKTPPKEKGVNGKTKAAKDRKVSKKSADTDDDSEVELIKQIASKPNRSKTLSESRKGAAVTLARSKDTGNKGKGKNPSSSAKSQSSANERKAKMSKASTDTDNAAVSTANGEKMHTSANGNAGEKLNSTQPAAEFVEMYKGKPTQTKVASGPTAEPAEKMTGEGAADKRVEFLSQVQASKASQKTGVTVTGETDGEQQSGMQRNPQVATESKVLSETQSTPERRRRRKPSTPSRTSPAKRKLDLSDNEFSFLD